MVSLILQRLDAYADQRDCEVPDGITLPLCSHQEVQITEARLLDSAVFKMMV